MDELHTLPIPQKRHIVIADDVPSPKREDANFAFGTNARLPDPSVDHIPARIFPADRRQNFKQFDRRSARRVFFHTVMDFGDLNIVGSVQNLAGCFRKFE